MALRGMMLASAAGLVLAAFAAPTNAAPTVASVGGAKTILSQAPLIDPVHYRCWWKDGLYRKCVWVGPGYYSGGYSYYDRPAYYGRPYRQYYNGEAYRYRRWGDGYRRERGW